MRSRRLASLVLPACTLATLAIIAAGCGEDAPPPMPAAVLGTYDVDVTK